MSVATYEGAPCRRAGHTTRYVTNGCCVACHRARNRAVRPPVEDGGLREYLGAPLPPRWPSRSNIDREISQLDLSPPLPPRDPRPPGRDVLRAIAATEKRRREIARGRL